MSIDPKFFDLVEQVLKNDKLEVSDKKKMLNELRKLLAPEQNRWNFRYAIWTLAILALSIPIVAIWSFYKKGAMEIPAGLLSLGSAAVGALAAFLSSFAQKKESESSNSSQSGK